MNKIHLLSWAVIMSSASACMLSCSGKTSENPHAALEERLGEIVDEVPGQCGVAVIIDRTDTVTLNNSADYPLMSMFKLHEALAVCHTLDDLSESLDTVISVRRSELDPETWSPMLKDYAGDTLSLTVGRLVDYILVDSDNNASNLLFDRIVSAPETDVYMRSVIPGEFRIVHKESDMKADHAKSYENCSSPLSYAVLVDKVFNDSIVSPEKQEYVRQAMSRCETGMARIAAGLPSDTAVVFAHRTGSGYVNQRGEVTAVNDGGFVTLPSGHSYSLSVFVKDFNGCQEEAEKVIARISEAVFSHVSGL